MTTKKDIEELSKKQKGDGINKKILDKGRKLNEDKMKKMKKK